MRSVKLLVLLAFAIPLRADVYTEAQLRQAIVALRGSTPPISIRLGTNITLTQSLPMIVATSNASNVIDGGGYTLDANNKGRAFFIQAGQMIIRNMVIAHAMAKGGNGGDAQTTGGTGGGGGMGAGAAIFVNSGAVASVSGVTFGDAVAIGGNGGKGGGAGYPSGLSGGGGGGLGGDGGIGGDFSGGGGGGYEGNGGAGGEGGGGGGGEFGNGGNGNPDRNATVNRELGGGGGGVLANGADAVSGGAGGGSEGGRGGTDFAHPGSNGILGGGGGGAGLSSSGGGGGIGGGGGGSGDRPVAPDGTGGDFGGGGGGFYRMSTGFQGGFGGGGGGIRTGFSPGGQGGFGGGGAGGDQSAPGQGGQYAGSGGSGSLPDGGGGAALGGAIFVRQGGSLSIFSAIFQSAYAVVAGGTEGKGGASNGQALGPIGFLMPGATFTINASSSLHLQIPAGIAGGGSIIKSGSGELAIGGNETLPSHGISATTPQADAFTTTGNPGFNGTITVSAGTLRLANVHPLSTGTVTVRNQATLSGHGSLEGLMSLEAGGRILGQDIIELAGFQWAADGTVELTVGEGATSTLVVHEEITRSGSGNLQIVLHDSGSSPVVNGHTYELIAFGPETNVAVSDFEVTGVEGTLSLAPGKLLFTAGPAIPTPTPTPFPTSTPYVPPPVDDRANYELSPSVTNRGNRLIYTFTNTGRLPVSNCSLAGVPVVFVSGHAVRHQLRSQLGPAFLLNGKNATGAMLNGSATVAMVPPGDKVSVVFSARLRGEYRRQKADVRVQIRMESPQGISLSPRGWLKSNGGAESR